MRKSWLEKKSNEKGFLKPKYFGPCNIIGILGNKCYQLVYRGTLFVRNEYHIKPYKGTISARLEEQSQRDTSITSRPPILSDNGRYPRRERARTHHFGYT